MEKIAGVILSGGLSRRFQTDEKYWIDKALVEIEGKPILVRLIEILKAITDEILIIVNNDERKQSYQEMFKRTRVQPVKIIIDEKGNCKGPLLGILTGMKNVEADYCLFLPCDLPYMKVETLNLLIKNVSKSGITLFIHEFGEIEPLPAKISVKNCLEVSELICKLGKRRVDDIFRGCTDLILVCSWRVQSFDPGFQSFINLNYPNDLKEYKPLKFSSGTVANSFPYRTEQIVNDKIELINKIIDNFKSNNIEPLIKLISELIVRKLFYWAASLYEFLGKYDPKYFNNAAEFYLKESNLHSKFGMTFLARHAELDQKWCLNQFKQLGK